MNSLEMWCILNTLAAASDKTFYIYGNSAHPSLSFPARLIFSFSTLFFLLVPSFCISSTNMKVQVGYPHCLKASFMFSISSCCPALSETKVLAWSNRVQMMHNFWWNGWWLLNFRYWSVWVVLWYILNFEEPSSSHWLSTSRQDRCCWPLSLLCVSTVYHNIILW